MGTGGGSCKELPGSCGKLPAGCEKLPAENCGKLPASCKELPASGKKLQGSYVGLPGWVRALSVMEPREASDYASVGTSAGVAIAFNAPIAGMAYAVEEGNTVFSVAMLWKVRGLFAGGRRTG